MFAKPLRLIIIAILLFITSFNNNITPCSAQSSYICGYSTSGYLQSGMTAYPYPYIVACSTGEKIAWGQLGLWGTATYVRINDPEIVNIPSDELNDGTVISKRIQNWTSSSQIPDCNACVQVPTQPPTQIPTNTQVPPTATRIPQAVSSPVFVYPQDGQTLGYDGDYLFKVEPIEGADGYLWGFFQNGESTWENLRDEGTISGNDYSILSGSEAHSRFKPGKVEVWVRASVDGQLTEPAVIVIYLQGTDTPIPTPPKIILTNFTLADTLTNFYNFQPPIVLVPNTLWIQITNVGQSPFYPPGGSGQYALQVILKKSGEKLEEYNFVPGQPISLAPLGNLEAGESQTLFVPDLFFFTPVDNAEIEVFFAPDTNLGMQNSIYIKPVSVQEHPGSFQRCAGTVAQAMVKAAKIACPECRAALTYPDLAIRTLKCGADGGCIAKENAKWLFGLALGLIGDAGQLLSLAADALLAMGEPPPCIIVSDWLNAYLHEAIRNRYNVNGVITESPVYPLVTNEAGQQAGFLENGQIVEEIPGSKVVVLGEERFILYPGNDASQLSVLGYAEGKMNLYATFAQEPGQGTSIRYNDVHVTQGMMATLRSSNSQYTLEIDTNSDGSTDQSLLPDEILAVTEKGAFQQPIEAPTSIAPTITSNPPQQPGRICGGAFGLLALPILVIWRQRRKKAHK